MGWQQLKMPLATLDQARCEQAMLDAGAAAITYTDAADQPILEPAPGEAPLWREAILTALFDDKLSFEHIALTLMTALDCETLPDFDIELLPEREWERAWLDNFHPMLFGRRLWVCPHQMTVDADDAVVVRLDPGLAFGTGTHATTSLCLQRLDALALDAPRVLDFGCGSGILAIAALKLGAREVDAVDIDPQAITATRTNASDNGVDAKLNAMLPNAFAASPDHYDLVLANILAQPLIDNAALLCPVLRHGGRLLLSGILGEQAKAVRDAYAPWIEFAPIARQDGWVLLDGIRR
ncbi:MAG: 50S ribosomal protein L11 methyltransferase [Pseudomonadota bacterium]